MTYTSSARRKTALRQQHTARHVLMLIDFFSEIQDPLLDRENGKFKVHVEGKPVLQATVRLE